ncbi:MAG: DUF2939 domain-containing protein [Alphaproteobacteria bacterium]|nr:DUF2939 domain-containing protein [Alphaproteobacteria bacterium]MBU2269931.1 DUF2939 domain-containing protein [Alphaproteobacteria bacterium]MBU2418747.1 DUF2939 domain-containing protein [Alphaproteobacteria bacterium]
MKKLFGNLLLLAVIAAVVSFFVAPAVAFFGIRSAADANDVAGLSRLVDFTAVRQSLRPQLSGNPAAMAPAPTFLEDPIGAVRRQFEPTDTATVADADAYLTPAALAGLTRGDGRFASQRSSAAVGEAVGDPMPAPVFWSVNRARLAVTDEGGSRTIFTFERKGPFEWKLVHIGLPEGTAPAVPAGSVPGATPAPAPRR